MRRVTIELPDTLPTGLRASDEDVAREVRLALAILWYDRGQISQGKGAEIAGLTRAEFIDELGRANVSAIQTKVEELRADLARGGSVRQSPAWSGDRAPSYNTPGAIPSSEAAPSADLQAGAKRSSASFP